ncbi:hypothetical protein MAR_009680 [Mya arenaria]|uniref:Uncharacterized protein n=1 Tax=Mya arenaria TaxID=6604 RepID=A0ABY7E2G6_MYAAR|nr:uncharacterized protein LOC128230400 [Mya arenaria]WAR03122.1 hypothetical protein MAR_009680 [Mya arenaria]
MARMKLVWRWDGVSFLVIIWILMCLEITDVHGTKCYRNEDIGEIPANVYYCSEGEKTECCEEDEQFTCCEPQAKKTLREQLILWGVILAVGLGIALVCGYFWKDNLCSKDDRSCRHRCCPCCVKKDEVDTKQLTGIVQPTPFRPATSSGWRSAPRPSTSMTDSPPPAFHYKSTTYGKY